MQRAIFRLGAVTLFGNTLQLRNKTNNTRILLGPEGAARWRKYLMAYQQRGGGRGGARSSRGGNRSGTVRLTGMFKAKAKRGLWVGSMDELEPLVDLVRKAVKTKSGLVFFLWRNEESEHGPVFALSVAESNDEGRGARRSSRAIEPADDEDDAPRSADDDDEVPF